MHVGKQPDGSFLVATGQRIESDTISFDGRPIDLAMHPSGKFFAVLKNGSVFLCTTTGIIPGSDVKTAAGPAYHGCIWSHDGSKLFVSLASGSVQEFKLDGEKLVSDALINLSEPSSKVNPAPGGLAASSDGKRLYVACANLGVVVEINLETKKRVREYKVQCTPFDVKLSTDEKIMVVSNWAGRDAEKDEEQAESGAVGVLVDERGIPSSGSVSLVDLDTATRTDIPVGLHPAGLAVDGDLVYVANAGSDSISEISLKERHVTKIIPVKWKNKQIYGSQPSAIVIYGDRLYVCDGTDNAVCEIDRVRGRVLGFRPAGFFPVAIGLTNNGKIACVVNTKGNGSVKRTVIGKPGNAHDFQGTVSIINLEQPLYAATEQVATNNGWRTAKSTLNPDLDVYKGKIKHVLYIIKENRTYDEVFGDMPQGNGDKSLCGIGERITPNHHALAHEFALFDNAYVCGTNSAEGHQWALEGLGNDYIERFYGGYTRSYPYDGRDAMAYSTGGFIWDAAAAKQKSIRIYGEFCAASLAKIDPYPKTWLDAWKDRQSGSNRIKIKAATSVVGMRKYIHPRVLCWPILFSDQWRADEFISEYNKFSKEDKVPNLMLLTLPCDHTAGTSPDYPKPDSMVADNDLALGRVVEAISKSPQWKDTCIFVMEDDAQNGVDHVDGHRTVCMVISPYIRKGVVDSTMYTQLSILHSIELMLGLKPLARLDAMSTPFTACFTDEPNLRPYIVRANRVKLDDMNPPLKALSGQRKYWAEKSVSLDWSDVDSADWYWLNRILWHSSHGYDKPYPKM